MRCLAILTLSTALIAAGGPALAQSTSDSGAEFTRPYGLSPGETTRPYQGARGAGGNRVVINGIIQTGVGVQARASARGHASAAISGGVGGEGGMLAQSSATAIANQLNVVVDGRYNTVVVNSRQTNSGDVTANAGAGISANGEHVSRSETETGGDQ